MIQRWIQLLQDRYDTVSRRRPFLLMAVALLFTILYTGLGIASDTVYYRLSLDPFRTRLDIKPINYYQETVLQPLLANTLHLRTLDEYSLFCLTLILVGLMAFALLAVWRAGRETGALLFLLLLAHPIRGVLYGFIGMPDALTFALTVPLLFMRSPFGLGLVAALGVTNHAMFLFIVPATCALRWIADESGFRWRQLLAGVAGLAAGCVLLHGFLLHYGITLVSRYECVHNLPLIQLIHNNFSHFPMTVFSFHGALWAALAVSLAILWRPAPRYVLLALAVQAGLYATTVLTADTTRVFTLLAWAPTLHAVMVADHHVEGLHAAETQKQWRLLLLLVALGGLLLPMYSVWGGAVIPANSLPFYQSIVARFISSWATWFH